MRIWTFSLILMFSGACGPEGVVALPTDTDTASTGEPPTQVDSSGEPVDEPPADPFEGARHVTLSLPDGNMTFGDYDGDGVNDVLVSYEWELGTTNYVQQRLSAHRFVPETEVLEELFLYELGIRLRGPFPGHVNAGSRTDIISNNYGDLIQVALFEDDFEIAPSVEVEGVLLGRLLDYDRDGRSDYISAYGSSVRTYSVDLMGGWELVQWVDLDNACNPRRVQWADLMGDEALEVVVLAECDEQAVAMTLVQDDQGLLSLAFESNVGTSENLSQFELADFDGDQILDLAITTTRYTPEYPPAELSVITGQVDGSFGPPLLGVQSQLDFGAVVVHTADLDGDGVAEPMVWGYPLSDGQSSGHAMVELRDGEAVLHDVPFLGSIDAHADLDGDGCEELIADEFESIEILRLPCA